MKRGLKCSLGIDLTSSPRRPSALAALGPSLGVIYLEMAATDDEILNKVAELGPSVVAIDSPLGLPRGLCCLEECCPCQPALPAKGRQCERELARLGIPCYFTTKRSIIKGMVYRAMGLRGELEGRGYTVLEVYPYAAKVRLFGRRLPLKTKPEGLAVLTSRLCTLIPGLAQHGSHLTHDLCDALVAAYTTYLWGRGQAEALGYEDEACIIVPLPSAGRV